MKNPLVSVVVITKNEEKHIRNCLESIKAQTYKNIETIVVDNASTDQTKEIARVYSPNLFDKGPERSAQRNYGAAKSQGEYVMFVDADMILSPDLITGCAEVIQKNDYLALHIPEVVLGKTFFSCVRRFERSFYNGTVIDGARFFQKKAFVKTGGFDQNITGPEDWDIDKKIKKIGKIGLIFFTPEVISQLHSRQEEVSHLGGGKWKLENLILEKGVEPKKYGAVVYHNEAEFDLGKYLAKKGYYSTSFDTYIKKWGANDPDIKKQLGFYYRFLGVFIENGKWKKLIIHPFLTLGMYYLRILVGIKYLTRKNKD